MRRYKFAVLELKKKCSHFAPEPPEPSDSLRSIQDSFPTRRQLLLCGARARAQNPEVDKEVRGHTMPLKVTLAKRDVF